MYTKVNAHFHSSYMQHTGYGLYRALVALSTPLVISSFRNAILDFLHAVIQHSYPLSTPVRMHALCVGVSLPNFDCSSAG